MTKTEEWINAKIEEEKAHAECERLQTKAIYQAVKQHLFREIKDKIIVLSIYSYIAIATLTALGVLAFILTPQITQLQAFFAGFCNCFFDENVDQGFAPFVYLFEKIMGFLESLPPVLLLGIFWIVFGPLGIAFVLYVFWEDTE